MLLRPLGQLSMAPQAGFEPATDRLTADSSTTELLWNEDWMPGNVLLSQGDSPQLPSALKSLTSVFGMGTGVTSSPSSPDILLTKNKYYYKQIVYIIQYVIPSKLDNLHSY